MLMKQNKKLSSRIASLEAKIEHFKTAASTFHTNKSGVAVKVATDHGGRETMTLVSDAEDVVQSSKGSVSSSMPTSRKRSTPDDDLGDGETQRNVSESSLQHRSAVATMRVMPASTRAVYAPPPSEPKASRVASSSAPLSGFTPVRRVHEEVSRKKVDLNHLKGNSSPRKASSVAAAKLSPSNSIAAATPSSKFVDRTNRPVTGAVLDNGSVLGAAKTSEAGPHLSQFMAQLARFKPSAT